MRDVLLEIGSRPAARRLIRRLGLPLPLPQKLMRGRGAWEARPLADQNIVVGGTAGGTIGSVLAKAVAAAGGYPVVASGDAEPFREIGKAYGRPATTVDSRRPAVWASRPRPGLRRHRARRSRDAARALRFLPSPRPGASVRADARSCSADRRPRRRRLPAPRLGERSTASCGASPRKSAAEVRRPISSGWDRTRKRGSSPCSGSCSRPDRPS